MNSKKESNWQFTVSTFLALLMLFLILGYFVESFITIRKDAPVTVAIERISESKSSTEK